MCIRDSFTLDMGGCQANLGVSIAGHIFCWGCIVEWASSKPECPLCRQSMSLQSLLRLFHYAPPA
eukprot:2635841-Rhodomonas_salina.1